MGTNRTGIGIGIGIPFKNNALGQGRIISPDLLASLKAVVICDGKSNDDSDRAVLRNLVDKDNPFVASNFAWKLNSGYGGYNYDYTSGFDTQGTSKIINKNTVHINQFTNQVQFFKIVAPYIGKIKVSGLSENILYLQVYSSVNEDNKIIITKDGIYDININETSGSVFFFIRRYSTTTTTTADVTIEQLPSHDGALVFDGVNDRVISTKTMQEMVGDTNAVTVVSMIHQISLHSTNTRNNYVRPATGSGYMFNNVGTTGVGKTGIYGYSGSISSIKQLSPLLGDKADYNAASTAFNGDMPVFSVNGFIQGSEYSQMSKIAWYWTIIANKVLTTDEIHQVIAYYNLDKHVKPDIYYDVKKQGLTNENHAQFNDKLIDYSGNGHDMQLYNIGWSGGSGIGRYLDIFNSFSPNALATREGNYKCHVDATGYLGTMFFFHEQSTKAAKSIPSFKIRLSDLSGGGGKVTPSVIYSYIDTNGSKVDTEPMVANGIYTLPESHIELVDEAQVGFVISYESIATIEELPDNDGSLVLDGVNDYGQVNNIPIKKDYTVVSERSLLGVVGGVSSFGLISDREIIDDTTLNTFIVEKNQTNYSYSFGASKQVDRDNSMKFSYQTKYFYNGKTIPAGNSTGNNKLLLGAGLITNGVISEYCHAAINSLMVFPYSLDEFLIERQLKRHKLGTLHPDLIEFRPIVKSDGKLGEVNYFLNTYSTKLYPGDYIPKGSTVLVNLVSTSEVDEFKYLKVNGKEVKFNQAIGSTNRVYTSATVVYNKAPLKIEVSLDNYIRFEDIQHPYPFVFSFVNAETDEEYAWGDKIKYGTKLQIINKFNLLVGVYKQTIDTMFTWNGNVIAQDTLMSKEFVVGKDKLVFGVQGLACEFTNEPNVIAAPQKLRLPNISYKRLGYIPDISGHGNNIKLYNSGYSGMSGANGYGTDLTKWSLNNLQAGILVQEEDYVEIESHGTSPYLLTCSVKENDTFILYADVDIKLKYLLDSTPLAVIPARVPTKVVCTDTDSLILNCVNNPQDGDIITIQQVGLYDGAFCFDGVNDYGQIPTLTQGGKQVFMKLNRMGKSAGFLYDQRKNVDEFTFALSVASGSIAYNYRNSDELTYIDAIENKNVMTDDLKNVTHNITAINSNVTADNSTVPVIASSSSSYFSKIAMYSFALFPEISDESEIIRFNEIMGIEGKYVERPMRYFDAYGKTNQDTDKDTITDQVTKLPANVLTLKNVGYEGMSGYDGYPVVFGAGKTFAQEIGKSNKEYLYTLTATKINVTQIYTGKGLVYSYIKRNNVVTDYNTDYPSFRLKVTGTDTSKFKLVYYYLASASTVAVTNYPMDSDGTYTLPKSFANNGSLTAQDVYIGIAFRPVGTAGIVSDVNLTLEVLPDYENGLALDGVNDHLENTTLPILTDFTFITKRKNLLSTYADGTEYIRKGLDNNNRKWALLGEYWYNNKCMNYVFNRLSNDVTQFDLLGFITPTNYNGTTMSFLSGEVHEDSQGIYIGKSHWKGVFYKLMIFDKTVNMLTINMIKNMMAKDGIVDLNNQVFKK